MNRQHALERERYADESQEESFSEAARLLLGELLDDFHAERAFFLEWHPIAPGVDVAAGRSRASSEEAARGEGVQRIEVLHAYERDGGLIEHPDYHLDLHYLREIGGVEGARVHGGPEQGVGRALLTCSLPLDRGARALVLLEGTPGQGFSPVHASQLEEHLAGVHHHLLLLHRLAVRDEELARLRNQVHDLAEQLEVRDEAAAADAVSTWEPAHAAAGEVTRYHQMHTRSPAMREVFAVIDRVKDTNINVLVVGETGTGKELVARAIHYGGNRAHRPFEVVACGSLPVNLIESELFGYRKGAFSGADSDRKGVFERATGGSVFLDELGDMPAEMQQKILRVLQENVVRPIGSAEAIPIDVRVISSTQRDLADLVQTKQFREDLFYRLNVITIEVPPLRERREDIDLLLGHFVLERNQEDETSKRLSDSALRELQQYSWPGNVQELKNVVTRAFLATHKRLISRRVLMPLLSAHGGTMLRGKELHQEGDHLCLTVPAQDGFNEIVAEVEKLILITSLRRNRGNKSRVTQQLGIPRQTLYNKLEKYGIAEEDYATESS